MSAIVRIAALALGLLVAPSALAETTLTRDIGDEHLANEAPLGPWHGKTPNLADVDGDGKLDLVAQNGNGRVYAIDPRAGTLLAEVAPRYPYGPDLGPFNGPRAADLDGDGVVELVNVNRAAVVSVWKLHPEGGGVRAELAWDRHLNDHHGKPTADAGPVLGDVDGDGKLEILVQTEETGAYALRADGSVLWSLANYGGNAEPRIADVDRDGDKDVVFFTDGGVVYAVDGKMGNELWRFDASRHGAWPASIASPGAVADIDGDGRMEVTFCARNIQDGTPDHAPQPFTQHHFVLFAIRDGTLVWSAKPEWGNPLCSAYMMAFDANGDGKMEVYGMDWNNIGHKPGDWSRLETTNVFSFSHDGRELWRHASDPWNSKAPIAAGDWTGDGKVDVVAYGASGLEILDALSGKLIERVSVGHEALIQGPLLADIDSDGDTDAIVAHGSRFYVLDTGAAVTNFGWPGWG